MGYSSFPWEGDTSKTDGVVIRYDQIGTNTKTLEHEAGHYLGLYHPFQNGCASEDSCSTTGDYICDTPPTSEPNFSCFTTANSCNGDTPMTENYMDYSACSYLFTKDQAVRINYFLPNYRSNQYSMSNLNATGVVFNPIECAPIADFYSSTSTTCANKPVQFFSASFNATVSSYYWSFPGGTPGTSTDSSPVVIYTLPGTYSVSLIAKNSQGNSVKTKNDFITIPNDTDKLISPFTEGFETSGPSTVHWLFPQNTGSNGKLDFKVTSAAANTGKNSLYLENRDGLMDTVYSFTLPPVDISKITDYTISFSYAYAKTVSANTDRLQVFISQDCGDSFEQIFSRLGGLLTTTTRLVPSATDFVPDSNEWKQASASFASYSASKELYFKFDLTNGGGNDVYIDNINIGGASSGINNKTSSGIDVELYPNPVTSQIAININSVQNAPASILAFDMAGRKLAEVNNIGIFAGRQEFSFQTSQLNISSPGMYYLKMCIGNSVVVKKIIVAK